ACCYGSHSLLTNFYYPREWQNANVPCLFHPDIRDSALDWRVVASLFLGLDPPNSHRGPRWPSPWAGMAELTLIVGRLMSRSWSKHGTPRKPCLLALKAHELLI